MSSFSFSPKDPGARLASLEHLQAEGAWGGSSGTKGIPTGRRFKRNNRLARKLKRGGINDEDSLVETDSDEENEDILLPQKRANSAHHRSQTAGCSKHKTLVSSRRGRDEPANVAPTNAGVWAAEGTRPHQAELEATGLGVRAVRRLCQRHSSDAQLLRAVFEVTWPWGLRLGETCTFFTSCCALSPASQLFLPNPTARPPTEPLPPSTLRRIASVLEAESAAWLPTAEISAPWLHAVLKAIAAGRTGRAAESARVVTERLRWGESHQVLALGFLCFLNNFPLSSSLVP